MDKETAPVDGKTVVLPIDMQDVLLTPAILANALYYKTKLWCHNFNVHDMTSKNVCYYCWHESEGGLQSTSFARCPVDYIDNELNNIDVNTIIIFSDGCGYQNVNITMSNALTFYYKTPGKTAVQKCLTKRHTQIEVDFVHRLIDRKLKKKQVYSPAGYVTVMLEARTSNPYCVKKEFYIFKVLKGQLY